MLIIIIILMIIIINRMYTLKKIKVLYWDMVSLIFPLHKGNNSGETAVTLN